MTMDFNEFKANWQASKIDVNDNQQASRQVFDMLRRGRCKTSVERLANYYKRFMVMSAAMLLMSYWFFGRLFSDVIIEPWQQATLAALWVAIMAVAGAADGYLYFRLSRLNVGAMTVVEVAGEASRCRRIHLLSQLVLMPLAIAFFCIMVMAVRQNEAMLLGVCLGGVFGLCVGLRIWLRIMRLYKSLIEDSHDLLDAE